MVSKRLIPILLIRDGGLMKSRQFSDWRYVGDPINTAKIFNDKDTDELMILDVDATGRGSGPNLDLVKDLVAECFLPIAYGGGVRSLHDAQNLVECGVDKVVVNSAFHRTPSLIRDISEVIGTSSTVVSLDVVKSESGFEVLNSATPLADILESLEGLGAGEVLIQSVNRDGTRTGPDFELAELVSIQSNLPLIYAGGVASLGDAQELWKMGFDAVAAGSWFVFSGGQQAVLVTYPQRQKLDEALSQAQ